MICEWWVYCTRGIAHDLSDDDDVFGNVIDDDDHDHDDVYGNVINDDVGNDVYGNFIVDDGDYVYCNFIDDVDYFYTHLQVAV